MKQTRRDFLVSSSAALSLAGLSQTIASEAPSPKIKYIDIHTHLGLPTGPFARVCDRRGPAGHDPGVRCALADLRRRGFRFVGSTIVYSFMQSVGLVDDHCRVVSATA